MTLGKHTYDIAIVGAGILGLAHAKAAVDAGLETILFERGSHATGASIRNFGMVWPVGQPAGAMHDIAMKTRECWLKLSSEAGIWAKECGSLHLARRADELAVLEEFSAMAHTPTKLLTRDQAVQASEAVKADGLLGALWSPTELCVNPKTAIDTLARWLTTNKGLHTRFGTTVTAIGSRNELVTSDGSEYLADRIVVCSGADFETLFPDHFANAGLQKCKLQMLSTEPQPTGWSLGPHIAGGLTLRHYQSFKDCPSLSSLRQRVAREQPHLDQFGIHVMAAMNDSGEVILGDSHEYEQAISPFDSAVIDELIVEEIQKLIGLPNFKIRHRWHGIYAKHPREPIVELNPQPNCQIVTAPGGAGMTLSFGIAESNLRKWK